MKRVLLSKHSLSELRPTVNFINRLTTEQSNFSTLSQCSRYAWYIVKNSGNLGFHLVLDAILLQKNSKALILSLNYFPYP